ncbi:MAG: hypothetical protein QM743_00400 [Chitinophagaceae bacterium]
MVRLLIYEDNEKLRKSLKLLLSGMSDIALLNALPNCSACKAGYPAL